MRPNRGRAVRISPVSPCDRLPADNVKAVLDSVDFSANRISQKTPTDIRLRRREKAKIFETDELRDDITSDRETEGAGLSD